MEDTKKERIFLVCQTVACQHSNNDDCCLNNENKQIEKKKNATQMYVN